MNQILELLKQRRVWAGIIGVVAFVSTTLNLGLGIDVEVLTNLFTQFGLALAALIQALLALWSYFKPKDSKK